MDSFYGWCSSLLTWTFQFQRVNFAICDSAHTFTYLEEEEKPNNLFTFNFKRIIQPMTNDHSNTKYHNPYLRYTLQQTRQNYILWAFAKLRNATICIVKSVRLFAWNNFASTGWLLIKVDI